MKKTKNSIKLLGAGIALFVFSGTVNAQDQSPQKTSDMNNETTSEEYTFACTLPKAELLEKKAELAKEIFAKIKAIKELAAGYQLVFDDTEGMALRVADFMLAENICCPFLNFDLSLLAFKKGIALGITGEPEKTKNFMRGYFKEMGVAHLLEKSESGG